jgi:hypothetical protein
MEDRYAVGGLPDSPPLDKRSPFPDVAPYDIAADRRQKREKRAVATVSLLDSEPVPGCQALFN